ncbi:ACP S-malonyltransferase [Pseudohongiella spirulinae]|uniref:Malonyl CoA-acyl carrier protein transacylase n=1 Tax=Pseudohongiella spirulinae TaxID=1249552 RepID=A0A0S2KDL1_9GAMM|nr:Malonyl CoA-acyl carrier protein transacylase [Pseudohongiella spirulinae]
MQKIGFVFPGQGSQKQGMLADMLTSQPVVKETFDEASDILGQDLIQVTQENPDGLLDRTEITQPALLTVSVALWRAWMQNKGSLPEMLAGHSLGEYSALVCANVISFRDAVRLVHMRGKYMQQAVPEGTGAMAAIIGMDDSRIDSICRQVAEGEVVSAVNFNSPGQTVIAGTREAVGRAMTALKEAGAKRALPLNVSVPSHCALMKPAAEQLAGELADTEFRTPSLPVVQNINGRATREPGDIRENLLKQLYMPVQWVDTIYCMRDFGVGKIVECGPGKVLAGLVKRIHPEIDCYATDNLAAFNEALEGVR